MRKAEILDAQDDARYGKGKRGDELPKELQRRQDRLDALRKAKAELEAEAAADNARRREQQARAAEEQAAEAAAATEDNGKTDAESEAALGPLSKRRSKRSAEPAVPAGERSWPAGCRSTRPRLQASQARIR
ncbi:hypothetical protein KBY96_15860 [Cyanobium sp. ATX 6A2]|uniref:hypothetical protein n=1 Tax=Cyanobium sp. ATX 6A2 TaxID=2823700 RepID=UPI0020CC4AB8|nr:hypothetical protein [Cyanobium sp. ATX 6A2]MCP9889391.1 hypothetical protein [Cyanobium sp. ATX 6A2]